MWNLFRRNSEKQIKDEKNSKEKSNEKSKEKSKEKTKEKGKEETYDKESPFDPEQNMDPFKKKWMNTCYRRLAYPNPKSIEVMEKVNRVLPRHVIRPQSSEQKQQALFLLLGEDFTEHHFPKEKYNVKILDPPKLDPKLKKKYIKEMKVFLNEALLNAMEDCGYPRDLSKYKNSDDEMGRYIKEIRGTVSDAFSTQIRQDAFKQESKSLSRRKRSDRYSMFYNESDDEDEGEYDDDILDDVGVTYTPEAEAAGKSFLDFMDNESAKNVDYKKIIRGKYLGLPLSLRQFFWWQFFEKKEKERLRIKSGVDARAEILKDFENNLKTEMKKHKIPIATKSINAKRIDSHVIEMFDMSPPLKDLDLDDIMVKTTLALNMAGIHSDNYSPVKGLLFLPLQIVFKKREKETEEQHMVLVAATLTYLDKYCELNQKELFKMADEIIRIVEEDDPEYMKHIERSIKTEAKPEKIRPMDFPPEVLLQDTRAGVKVYNNLLKYGAKGEEEVKERYMDEFCDPAIFVRKWIGQLFVGVLSINGMMWAWDQMFLSDWSRNTIKNIAIAIFALIRPWMMRASTYSGVRNVFIKEPPQLYTSDLRAALALLENGALITQVPANSNFIPSSTKQKNNIPSPSSPQLKRLKTSEDPKPRSSRRTSLPIREPLPDVDKDEKNNTLRAQPGWKVPVLPLGAAQDFNLSFHLDDNPKDDDDDGEDPGPVREPLPDSDDDDNEDEPVRKRDPNEPDTPPDTPPPPLTSEGWVEQDSDPVNPPEPSRISDPFDFYIDYVRFLPDNVRVCKVTGRIMNSNLSKNGYKDLMTFPLIESFQRSPAFRYKQTINPEKDSKINPDTVIVLKVYGYEEISNDISIVGSCLIAPFSISNHKYMLNAGGHQLRLRHGGPNPAGGPENLRVTDMDHNSPIPAASICVRLLKANKIYDPTPRYEDGYYDTSLAKPNASELRLFDHYMNDRNYTTWTVEEELQAIQKRRSDDKTTDPADTQKYLTKILDHLTAQRKRKSPIPDMNYSYFAKYDPKQGVNICIQGAFGLPAKVEGYYTHALGEVLPGRKTQPDVRDKKSLQVVTKRHDLTSYQRSPDWLDSKTTLYPPYDTSTVLLVQVYGIKLKYIPRGGDDGVGADGGNIEEDGRDSFRIEYDRPLVWGIMTIFKYGYSKGGLHLVAIFEGQPKKEVLSMLEKEGPAEDVLKKCIANRLITPEPDGFLEVEIYDGHIESEDIPEPAVDTQLRVLGIRDTAIQARSKTFRGKLADFVLENMTSSDRSKGITGTKFKKEGFTFQEEASTQFYLSLNKALQREGKPEVDMS